jgi:hypothetical protein
MKSKRIIALKNALLFKMIIICRSIPIAVLVMEGEMVTCEHELSKYQTPVF